MKKPTVFLTAKVPLQQLVDIKHRCAWKNCRQTTALEGDNLPADWRWLALWWGPVGLPPWAGGNIGDRDAVLCPTHWRELDGLLEDIGQHLAEPKGTA